MDIKYQRDMPTQMKLVYDVAANALNADYCYEAVFSNDENKTAYDVLEEWYNLEKEVEENSERISVISDTSQSVSQSV